MKFISDIVAGFKARFTKVDTAVRKASGKKPKEESLLEAQRELMSEFYYDIFKKLSKRNAGNTWSFGYKGDSNRPRFTARGAYLFRKDINEEHLFFLGYYENHNNIVTASLTTMHKGQDLDKLIVLVKDTLLESKDICEESIERDDKGKVVNQKSLDEYWQMYLDLIPLMPLYYFDQKDVSYFLDHMYRAIFKLIAMEYMTQDGEVKEALRQRLEDDLYKAAQTGFYPLNVATYTHLRNCLPCRISKRMSPVNLKVKKMNQRDYVSPIEMAKAESLR